MGAPVVHVELIGPDPDRLRRFYAQLFDWDSPPGSPVAPAISGVEAYSFITPPPGAPAAAGGIGGGAGFAPHAIFYVGVENVTEALERVVELGGSVELAAQRNEGGQVTVAHFRDPAGNLVGVAGAH